MRSPISNDLHLIVYLGGLFPIAIIPAKCANGSIDNLTYAALHEIIEAATDPIPIAATEASSLALDLTARASVRALDRAPRTPAPRALTFQP